MKKKIAIVFKNSRHGMSKTRIRELSMYEAPGKKDNLKFLYENIECSTIDAVRMKDWDMWVDDEGLFVSGSVIHDFGEDVKIAGNVVLSKGIDDEGETVWFDKDDDAELIEKAFTRLREAKSIGETE